MGYFESRKLRYETVHRDLMNLCKKVTRCDPAIEPYINKNETLQDSVVFFKGDKMLQISLSDVPYRWNGPEPINGYLPNHKLPYVVQDIIDNLTPIHVRPRPKYNEVQTTKEEILDDRKYLELLQLY